MRSDQMDRLRRSAAADYTQLSASEKPKSKFNPDKPWKYIFPIASSENHPEAIAFWNEHAHQKCMRFLFDNSAASTVRNTSSRATQAQQYPQDNKRRRHSDHNSTSNNYLGASALKAPSYKICPAYLNNQCHGTKCTLGIKHPLVPDLRRLPRPRLLPKATRPTQRQR